MKYLVLIPDSIPTNASSSSFAHVAWFTRAFRSIHISMIFSGVLQFFCKGNPETWYLGSYLYPSHNDENKLFNYEGLQFIKSLGHFPDASLKGQKAKLICGIVDT